MNKFFRALIFFSLKLVFLSSLNADPEITFNHSKISKILSQAKEFPHYSGIIFELERTLLNLSYVNDSKNSKILQKHKTFVFRNIARILGASFTPEFEKSIDRLIKGLSADKTPHVEDCNTCQSIVQAIIDKPEDLKTFIKLDQRANPLNQILVKTAFLAVTLSLSMGCGLFANWFHKKAIPIFWKFIGKEEKNGPATSSRPLSRTANLIGQPLPQLSPVVPIIHTHHPHSGGGGRRASVLEPLPRTGSSSEFLELERDFSEQLRKLKEEIEKLERTNQRLTDQIAQVRSGVEQRQAFEQLLERMIIYSTEFREIQMSWVLAKIEEFCHSKEASEKAFQLRNQSELQRALDQINQRSEQRREEFLGRITQLDQDFLIINQSIATLKSEIEQINQLLQRNTQQSIELQEGSTRTEARVGRFETELRMLTERVTVTQQELEGRFITIDQQVRALETLVPRTAVREGLSSHAAPLTRTADSREGDRGVLGRTSTAGVAPVRQASFLARSAAQRAAEYATSIETSARRSPAREPLFSYREGSVRPIPEGSHGQRTSPIRAAAENPRLPFQDPTQRQTLGGRTRLSTMPSLSTTRPNFDTATQRH